MNVFSIAKTAYCTTISFAMQSPNTKHQLNLFINSSRNYQLMQYISVCHVKCIMLNVHVCIHSEMLLLCSIIEPKISKLVKLNRRLQGRRECL